MTMLYLVRHGETDWNRERRVQGHRDPPLNETGRNQARSLARRVSTVAFEAAYSSDLQRAIQTAEILLEGRTISLRLWPDLRERHLGRWEGQIVDDIATLDPVAWGVWLKRPRDHAPHGGETEVELERRTVGALSSIAKAHPTEAVLVVSHGGSIRAALYAWLGEQSVHTPNCGCYVIEVTPKGKSLVDTIMS